MIQQLKFLPIYKNVDEVSQVGGCVDLKNGYIDEAGAWRSRPGLLSYRALGTSAPVDGMYWWDEKQFAIYVTGGKIFAQISATTTPVELTLDPGVTIPSPCSPVFASTANRLYIAWGTSVATWLGDTSSVSFCTLGTLPTAVTQLAFLDGYILALNTADDLMYFAEPSTESLTAEPTWYAGDKAEGAPDKMNTLVAGWRDLIVCGRRSIELWYNAGNPLPASPFARREGAFIERGVLAPLSFVGANNTWFWLDHERKICMLQGNVPQVLSGAFDSVFQALTTVEDARGFTLTYGGKNWYIITFPTENRTFAYEYTTQQWAEWSEWYSQKYEWRKWNANAAIHAISWNKHLIASTKNDGTVYELSNTTHADGGISVVNEVTTCWIDHGTNARKRARLLRFRLKRGELVGVNPPMLTIRYRDDGNQTWSTWEEVDMGNLGETAFHVQLFRRGIYRARQYQLRMSGEVALVLQAIEEDVEVLR